MANADSSPGPRTRQVRVGVWATKGSFMLPDSIGDKLVGCPGHKDMGMRKSRLVRPNIGRTSHLTWWSALWAEASWRSKLNSIIMLAGAVPRGRALKASTDGLSRILQRRLCFL